MARMSLWRNVVWKGTSSDLNFYIEVGPCVELDLGFKAIHKNILLAAFVLRGLAILCCQNKKLLSVYTMMGLFNLITYLVLRNLRSIINTGTTHKLLL